MLHLETLTSEAKKLFPLLERFKEDFYLAGGTGLSLLIGHRISVDFDLFTGAEIQKTAVRKVDDVFRQAARHVMRASKEELTLLVDGVKITLLYYSFPIILPLENVKPIPILSAKEILATKAYTLGRRDELKDYIDLYAGIRAGIASLPEIIALASQKFGPEFNDRVFLEQLLYLDDISEVDIAMIRQPQPSKIELVNFFTGEIKQLSL